MKLLEIIVLLFLVWNLFLYGFTQTLNVYAFIRGWYLHWRESRMTEEEKMDKLWNDLNV